jgi:hypothetical protein
MPDCYFIVSSKPEQTGKDISECVKTIGGPGRLHKLSLELDKEKVHSRVHYETRELAGQYLDPLKKCIEEKGHTVEYAEVVDDFEVLGLEVPGYPPEPDPGAGV